MRNIARSDVDTISTTPLHVVKLDHLRDPRWASFVASHPNAQVHHHPNYLEALRRGYGFPIIGLACEDDAGQLRGILPLARMHRPVSGKKLSSLPYTSICGPLAVDREATRILVEAAIWQAQNEIGLGLELKVWSREIDCVAVGLAVEPGLQTYILNLPSSPEHLRFGKSRSHGAIKRAVQKAHDVGVVVRPAETLQDLRAWYRLYLTTMRHHAAPPRPYRFFVACWELLLPHGLMRLLLAEQPGDHGTRLLAGSMFFQFGETVFYHFNGRLADGLQFRPNDAIHWHAIHEACREGFKLYDFGPVADDNAGLAQFKSKWGAEPRQLYRYCYPALKGSGALKRGSATRRFASIVWPRLPLQSTVLLGECFHRYL